MGIYEALARVHAQAVDDAGVTLLIVDHNITRCEQTVDDRDHTLIAVVEKEGILLANELR